MKRHAKQMLALLVNFVMLFTQMNFVVSAEQKTVTSVSVEATEPLMLGVDGYWTLRDLETGGQEEFFYYFISSCDPVVTLYYSDGSSDTYA